MTPGVFPSYRSKNEGSAPAAASCVCVCRDEERVIVYLSEGEVLGVGPVGARAGGVRGGGRRRAGCGSAPTTAGDGAVLNTTRTYIFKHHLTVT